MKRILITGITGFVGKYLAELLRNQYPDALIIGTYLTQESLDTYPSLSSIAICKKINLLDATLVEELIKEYTPDTIFHLAALTSPSHSINNPIETIVNNITLEIVLLEAIKKYQLFHTRLLIISSADVYGKVSPDNLPINEQTPLLPLNPYAVSKIAQDFLGLQYFLSYNMPIIRVRPFNHTGPGQSPHFVVPSFAKQIALIEKKKQEPIILVGNLSAKRDFTDVRDVVHAYSSIMEKGVVGDVYNIGSGVSHAIDDVLSILLSFSSTAITIKRDQERFRAGDEHELRCDITKITKITGWKPTIGLEKTLKDTLDYWREIL